MPPGPVSFWASRVPRAGGGQVAGGRLERGSGGGVAHDAVSQQHFLLLFAFGESRWRCRGGGCPGDGG